MLFLWVALGGAVGATARHLVTVGAIGTRMSVGPRVARTPVSCARARRLRMGRLLRDGRSGAEPRPRMCQAQLPPRYARGAFG